MTSISLQANSPLGRSSRLPALYSLVTALVLAGCGDDEVATCSIDSDCGAAQLCDDGVCTDIEVVGCDDDRPCPDGSVCGDAGFCVDLPDADLDGVPDSDDNCPDDANPDQSDADGDGAGDLCDTDCDVCPLDEVCLDDGECGQVACAHDTDCPDGTVCVGLLCRQTHDCVGDADCADNYGRCLDGMCEPGCIGDADCGDPALVGCVDSACRFRCSDESDLCDSDESCVAGFCVPDECAGTGTEDCPDGERCEEGECVQYTPCDADDDCEATEECIDDACELRQECITDSQCPSTYLCLGGLCYRATPCASAAECSAGQDCIGGLCVDDLCRGPEDCPVETVCEAGVCLEIVAPDEVSRVVILTNRGTILPGEHVLFEAVALDGNGAIISAAPLQWSSSAETVASIDEAGTAVGGGGRRDHGYHGVGSGLRRGGVGASTTDQSRRAAGRWPARLGDRREHRRHRAGCHGARGRRSGGGRGHHRRPRRGSVRHGPRLG